MRNRPTVATLLALLGLIVGVERAVAQPAPTLGQSPFVPGQGPSTLVPAGVEAPPARRTVVRPHRTHRKHRVVRPAPPNLRKIAEGKGFKRVSDLVNFPKFFPSLGIIFVKPETLPLGPFLCFDRKDRLMATVYMVPIKDFNDHKTLEAPAFAGASDHTSIYFNPGHPGVDTPHYHFVIWHVPKKEEERVAK
jgi:hypothetical protein